jgi:perosamine synthetase
MIPLVTPDLTEVEAQAAYDVIMSGYVNEGGLSAQFEKEFAQAVGAQYAAATNNGTMAMAIALMALGIKDKEVIVPDVTMIGTAMGVVLSGNRPVVVDVRLEDACMDPAQVEAAITPRTAAILPVHYNGRDALPPALLEIARRHRLPIVEDAAGCLGSYSRGEKLVQLGTTGEFGCFSLASTKIATTGQGGVVTTNDPNLYERAARLKDWGRLGRKGIYHPEVGFNFKFTDIQAAIALKQLERLPQMRARRQAIYARYRQQIGDLMFSLQNQPGYCPWYVEIEGQDLGPKLQELGVGSSPIWPALHQQGAMRSYVSQDAKFPNATELAGKILWLPASSKLTDAEIDHICAAVREAVAGRS